MSSEPPNFSWCVDNVLCACAFPDKLEHLQYLLDHNVESLVSLTAEREVDSSEIKGGELTIVPVPLQDYTSPTLEQVEIFLKTVEEAKSDGKATCIHCAHGLGRSGTMVACYFVQKYGMDAKEAIAYVRNLRPGSVETTEQELFVLKFYTQMQEGKTESPAT